MKWRLLVCGIALLCFSGVTLAQSDRATINGVVKDPSGAVVPGVEVTAKNVGTNDQITVTTNDDGLYYIRNLPVGTYSLTFMKPGFKGFERKGLTLVVSQIAEINVVLTLGVATETVVVTAEASLLQTQTAVVSTNLVNEAVTELPLNIQGGRNLSTFMFNYVPGVEGYDYDSHINGSLAMTKEVMIDGTSGVAQLGGYISESQPPMEAVREFEVDTSGIRSDEGRTGGGVFRYELKSGTNDFHGSVYYFGRNDALAALPYFAAHDAKVPLKRNDYGFSFGGPVKKDKLFFFYSQEWNKQKGSSVRVSCVPTADERAGNFAPAWAAWVAAGSNANSVVDQCNAALPAVPGSRSSENLVGTPLSTPLIMP
jgi:hypothetical protein